MKKAVLFGVLFASLNVFSQVKVTPESKDLNLVYKGGEKKLVEDVQNNFRTFSSDFQVNGQFVLTFDLDKEGKIIHPKVSPEVNNDFAYALIRSFKRVKNNFNSEMPKNNLTVLLEFNPTFKTDDGRERFTESPMTDRFNANQN